MTSFHLRAVKLACAGAQSVESCNWDHMERRKMGEGRREEEEKGDREWRRG